MASTATNPDTLVTVKVAINGTNRRFKLALRDLGANIFPQKLRFLLALPPTQPVVFERYSDSAASYIVLDSNNPGIYKQLYRAAKAKLKLRIRVTSLPLPGDEAPKPADETSIPGAFPVHPPNYSQLSVNHLPPPSVFAVPATAPVVTVPVLDGESKLEQSVAEAVKKYVDGEEYRTLLTDTVREEVDKKTLATSEALKFSSFYPGTFVCGPPPNPTRGVMEENLKRARPESDMNKKSFSELLEIIKSKSDPTTDEPRKLVPGQFAVYCNNCDNMLDSKHYHCGVCDQGDFDLCPECVENGVHCDSQDHWLIKRDIVDGKVVNSDTSRIHPSRILPSAAKHQPAPPKEGVLIQGLDEPAPPQLTLRTCNACVEVFREAKFVTCQTCEDYDLCIPCHVEQKHGHHPGHEFKPASSETALDPRATALLNAGRNAHHLAICDGCDKSIFGVRHKCLNCPDWDFCSKCISTAPDVHPGHRFAPIYDPLIHPVVNGVKHHGIYCDGPLCANKGRQPYITGDRYKCALCHDTDFCANCEASPLNKHNKTHPLIKFKKPVKNVTVTTLGERDGEDMWVMGDGNGTFGLGVTKKMESLRTANAATQVQTDTVAKVPEVEPSTSETVEKTENTEKSEPVEEIQTAPLQAHFVRDTVADGTQLRPAIIFKQTWTLRNPGPLPWPVGCSVNYVGGDNMLILEPGHPASVAELEKASESDRTDKEIHPGEEHDFTVLLRTPLRQGKAISYWRLTDPSGRRFGHKLWCDVDVNTPFFEQMKPEDKSETFREIFGKRMAELKEKHEKTIQAALVAAESTKKDVSEQPKEEPINDESEVVTEHVEHVEPEKAPETTADTENPSATSSQMIFPKLEKESPVSSTNDLRQTPESPLKKEVTEDNMSEVSSWKDDDEEASFLTDDEYDILDASDEEFLMEQERAVKK